MRGRNRESPRVEVSGKRHPGDRSNENRQGQVRYRELVRRPKRETAFCRLQTLPRPPWDRETCQHGSWRGRVAAPPEARGAPLRNLSKSPARKLRGSRSSRCLGGERRLYPKRWSCWICAPAGVERVEPLWGRLVASPPVAVAPLGPLESTKSPRFPSRPRL